MLKYINYLFLLFFSFHGFSQQIGDGHAPQTITDFSAPLKSGIYNGLNKTTTGMTGDTSNEWQHLFVARHISTTNNYQLQMASSFAVNDRLFFRKIVNSTLSPSNSTWVELATRGANNYIGDQIIRGAISSSVASDTGGYLSLINPSKTGSSIAQRWTIYNMTGPYGNSLQFWSYDNLGCTNGGICTNRFTIMDNGNVGIGTVNPTSKLTVAGNISTREVKVTVDAGADFVFENDYNLPSLESVDRFIKKNKHLPEIASANEMKNDGINLSEMNIKLLQKIEELTLYSIDQNKKIEAQAKEIEGLKDLVLRVTKIENELGRK
jgi:hypothetical protein